MGAERREGDREKMHVASRQIMPVPSREIMLLRLSPLRPKYEDGDNEVWRESSHVRLPPNSGVASREIRSARRKAH